MADEFADRFPDIYRSADEHAMSLEPLHERITGDIQTPLMVLLVTVGAAALNAKMNVFAVTNSITMESVHKAKLLDKKFIIDNPAELKARVYEFIEEHNQ